MKKPWSVPYLKKPWFVTAFTKVIFLLSVLLAGATGAVADTFLTSGTWTAPAGVTSVAVEAWGGGGAGGGATSNTGPFKGGGGAGGQYVKKVVAVTPLAVYTIVVGAGGTGSTGSGTAGGDSTFGGTQVVAKGGAGGISYELGGGAGLGSTVNGVGDIVYKGGDGSAGGATAVGGAGGGGAGSTGAGGNASGNAAGTGTASGGGNGAAGLTAMGNGTTGFVAGGGGSGGYVANNTNRSGGGGAAGTVIVSYVAAPAVTTAAATALTVSGATLNGTVSSNGAITTVTFDYGLTTGYGSSATAAQSPLAAGASGAAVSAAVTGLTCNTLYHFRAKGVNSVGTSYGNDLTFTTSACPPQVTLTPASGGSAVPSNTAPACGAAGTWTTLTGPVVAETAAAQIGAGTIVLSAPAGFEFNTAAAVTILLTGSGNRNNNINNVNTGTAMATTVTATTITFTVTAVSTVANTLTWQGIQVRPTLSTPLASGNITHTGTSVITGVTNGVTNFGTLTEVTSTPACHTAPTATTNAATGITSAVATLNGTVSSNGADTTVSFEWGLTTAYGQTIPAIPGLLLASAVGAPVSADLIGLNCNTVFHYRVVATNTAGTTNGLDGTFTTGICSAPFPATACAATRFNGDLGCTANDVNITGITLAPGSISSCVSGNTVSLDLDLTVNFASPDRWDVGIFIANDGKLPTLLPANGGASSCSVDILPTTPPFLDLDGVPQGTLDTCGDGNGSIDDSLLPGGTVPLGDGVKRMTAVTLPCYATPASGGKLFVPFVVSWDNQKSPIGSLCTSNLYPVPNTTSKCNAPASSVAINVVVLPVITKTNGGTQINPGANTTYTVVITNNSGGTLLDTVFTDPVVTDLAINSVSCAAAAGATCPAMTSAAMIAAMQGAGINIPSASLPNNSTLTFTINATLSSGATAGNNLINTARVTIPLPLPAVPPYPYVEATDTDLIVFAPSVAKSFAPGTITEDASSVLTVTLTNPTASAVTGVSFTDTYPAGLVNTAAAGGATSCGGTVTAANNGNSLALSGGAIPASGSCTVTVNVTSATAGSYNNSTGTVTHDAGTIPAASATLTVNAAVFGAFNACDVAPIPNASCTSTTTTTDSRITTKIAGSSFSLDLVALKSDGTRQTNYNNTVFVELLDASNNGPSDPRDVYSCPITSTVIAALTLNPSFSPANNGLITVGQFTVANAYRDVRVRVTNVGGPARTGCSTDKFAIRPAIFTLIAQDTNAETAGTTRTLNIVDVSSGPVHKAGRPFTFTATAYNAAATPAPTTSYVNNAGHPSMTLSACVGTACTASFGTFSPGVTSFTSGTLFSEVASYSEVGSFNLTLQDTDFASVDAADTPASCAGYYVCSAPTPVGRFIPDHFDTAVIYDSVTKVFMPCPSGLACPSSGDLYYPWSSADAAWSYADAVARTAAAGFVASDVGKIARQLDDSSFWELTETTPTWSLAIFGKGFVYSRQPFRVQVTAKNAGGNTTQNYQGAFAKAVTLSAAASNGGAVIATGDVGQPTFAPTAVTGFSSGVGVASPIFTFATALTAPTNIFMRADEPLGVDGVTSLRASSVEGGVKVVSGRVKIGNAYGSELLPLPMVATVQYYNGTYWMASATDNVTSLTLDATYDVVKGATTGMTTPSPTGSATVSGGVLNILLGKPTAGPGSATIDPGVPNYLPLTSGRATFGVYKGNNQFIYLREMY